MGSRRFTPFLAALFLGFPAVFMLKPLHSLTTTLNLRPVTWPGLVYGNSTIFHYASRPETAGHVALTIDDGLCRSGPDRSLIAEVRSLLQEHGAQATFFLCSDYVEGFEQLAQELLKDGHEFGNHCPSDGVDYFSMPSGQFEQELLKTSQKIEELAGSKPRWFRAPQGKQPKLRPLRLGAQLISAAALPQTGTSRSRYSGSMHGFVSKYGMQHALGDCYCDDWAIEDSDWVAGTMLQQVRGGSVLILHMPERGFREHILKALELLLIGLQQKGLRAVTLSQLSQLAAATRAASSEGAPTRGYTVVTHHDFGSVDGHIFESKEEALSHWHGLSLFSAHMLLGPDGRELRYFGRRGGGRAEEMRRWAEERPPT